MNKLTVQTEQIGDIPLLINQQRTMGIAEILDEVIGRHGNRTGLSVGWMIVGWLSNIMSESDHRLSYVEEWAFAHLQALNGVIPYPLTPQDFSDDRLGDAIRILSDDQVWNKIEYLLNQRLVRVYELPQETSRVDTTTVSLYHDEEGCELITHGHSKDHRPDLAQLKVLLVTLDPLALPTVTMVLAGNRADDGLYVPAIRTAQASLSKKGMLYVGDSKMEALATRAYLVRTGDYYLMPLSQKGAQSQLLASTVSQVLQEEIELESVYALDNDEAGEERLLAQGWETERKQEYSTNGEQIQWIERLLLIYSPTYAQSEYRGLDKRIQTATSKLACLTPDPGRGKRQYHDLELLQAEVEAILNKHRVTDFLRVTFHEQAQERCVRRYKDCPARTEKTTRYQVTVTRDEGAIQAAYRTMGWRLYATNAPPKRLSLADAVRAYRGGVPTIERLFSRMKGRPLGLRPVFVRREDHLKGLIRLLSLALRILTLIEYVVRRSLQTEQDSLAGLIPGNPTRVTSRPTTERLLHAFKGITLSIVNLPGHCIRYVTPLSPLQNRILQLLKFSDSIYTELAQFPPIPP